MQPISLTTLFWTFFKINAVTFGGGYTIVAIIRDEMVLKRKWIDEEEMLSLITIAQSGPGAMAINTSILTGYRLKGYRGAFVALLASILPCLISISIIFYIYDYFKTNLLVKTILLAMAGSISAILVITVFNMFRQIYQKYPYYATIMSTAIFILSYLLHIPTIYLLLMGALLGYFIVKKGAH